MWFIHKVTWFLDFSIHIPRFFRWVHERQARRSDMSQAAWCQWTHLHASLGARLEVRAVWDDFERAAQPNFTGEWRRVGLVFRGGHVVTTWFTLLFPAFVFVVVRVYVFHSSLEDSSSVYSVHGEFFLVKSHVEGCHD